MTDEMRWDRHPHVGTLFFFLQSWQQKDWDFPFQETHDWWWSQETRITWRPNFARNTPLVLRFMLRGKCSDLNALMDSSTLSILCTQLPASLLLVVPYMLHHVTLDVRRPRNLGTVCIWKTVCNKNQQLYGHYVSLYWPYVGLHRPLVSLHWPHVSLHRPHVSLHGPYISWLISALCKLTWGPKRS